MTNPTRWDECIYYCLVLYCLLFAVSVPLAYFAVDLGLVLLLVRVLRIHHDIRPQYSWLFFVGTYLIICIVSAWNGYNMTISMEKVWQVSYTMVAPFLLASFVVKEAVQRKNLLLSLAISLTVACIYEVYQGLIGKGMEGAFLGRLQLAGQIVQIFPLIVFFTASVKWKHKYMAAVPIFFGFLTIVALIFTGVRGAWVAMGVVIAASFFKISVKMKYKCCILIAIVLISITVLVAQPTLQSRFVSGATFQSQSVSERILMWKSAVNIFMDHPLLGIGLGNFGDLYEAKYILPAAKEGRHPHPHNIFLQTLCEAGIFGFISFIAIWLYTFVVLLRNSNNSGADFWQQGAPIAVLGLLIYGLTDNVIYHFPAGFQFCWFIIGAAWNANIVRKDSEFF